MERDAKAELIGARVDGGPGELLGRHVEGRPDRSPVRVRPERSRGTRLATSDAPSAASFAEAPIAAREAEVHDAHRAVAADQHVLGLEVAVDEPGGVRGREPRAGGDEDVEDLAQGARPLGQPLGERPALDELHRDEDLAAERADVVHDDDVRVREPRHRLRLAQQARLRARRRRGADCARRSLSATLRSSSGS